MSEYLDLFDKQRRFTGQKIKKGTSIPEGAYILVTIAWIVDSSSRFLVTRRSLKCSWHPGVWNAPGGGVTSGEDTLTATVRETKEETGLLLNPENGELFCSYRDGSAFFDHWLFVQDFDIAGLKLQEDEVMDARAATWSEINNMKERGECVGRKILNPNFDAFDLLKDRFDG